MRISEYINALPDAYKKHPGSNNYKLLSLEQTLVQEFRDDIEKVYDTLDIRKATGYTLDLYGEIYDQPRGGLTDEQYRFVILQKAAQNLIGCDHTSIVGALAAVIGVPVDKFHLTDSAISGEVDVLRFPYDDLAQAGFTVPRAAALVESLLPVGVRITGMNVEHEVTPGTPLKIAVAQTHSESHKVDVKMFLYHSVNVDTKLAPAFTHDEQHILEVL